MFFLFEKNFFTEFFNLQKSITSKINILPAILGVANSKNSPNILLIYFHLHLDQREGKLSLLGIS
jgi:hypothetical protein